VLLTATQVTSHHLGYAIACSWSYLACTIGYSWSYLAGGRDWATHALLRLLTCGLASERLAWRGRRRGYYIDRRPGASMDPYMVTALLVATTCELGAPGQLGAQPAGSKPPAEFR
jgi:hypothetical protein